MIIDFDETKFKLVPLEPADEQQVAGAQAIRIDTTVLNKMFTANRVYREMVAIASKPPVSIVAQAPEYAKPIPEGVIDSLIPEGLAYRLNGDYQLMYEFAQNVNNEAFARFPRQPEPINSEKLSDVTLLVSTEWISTSQSLPEVKKGSQAEFIICCKRGHDGKCYVFEASYLNQVDLDEYEDEETGFISGWHLEKSHPDYDLYFESIGSGGDVVTHWMHKPKAPSEAVDAARAVNKGDAT